MRQVLAAQCDHWCRTEAKAFGAEDRRLDHVQAGFQTAIGLHPDLAAQIVATQGLMGLCEPQLPWRAGITNRCQRRAPVPPS